MLTDARIAPTLPVTDLERARKFYRDTLGLRLREEVPPDGLLFESSTGSVLLVYQRSSGPKGDNTACVFEVDDLVAVMRSLRKQGITFEEYDLPGLRTVNGVATVGDRKGAWFKDPDGNILGLGERAR